MLYTIGTSRGRCSDNMSHFSVGSLVSCWLLYSNFEPLGETTSKFCPSEHFSSYLYQIISSLRGRTCSGREGRQTVLLVTRGDPNSLSTVLDLIFLIP